MGPRLATWVVWVALAASCGRWARREPPPGPATPDPELQLLIAQLGVERVGSAACTDPDRARRLTGSLAGALASALERDDVDPRAWRACLRALQRRRELPSDPLLTALVPVYLRLLDRGPGAGERAAARLLAAGVALWDRPPEWVLPPAAREQLAAKLRSPDVAADEARAALEMEAGRYRGQPVVSETIEALEKERAEPTLRRMALRLPDSGTRDRARRAVLRPATPANSPEGEADGTPAFSLAGHAAKAAEVDPARLPFDEILVRQDIDGQRAALLAAIRDPEPPLADRPASGVQPAAFTRPAEPGQRSTPRLRAWPLLPVLLRGALQVSVEGLPEPITVCGDANDLDPRPCLAPGELVVAAGPGRTDPGAGALVLKPELPLAELVALAAKSSELEVQLRLAGQIVPVRWPLRFLPPADMVFSAARGRGPDLTVKVQASAGGPVVVRALPAGGTERIAIVERADLPAYRIVSRGASGEPGAAGRDGRDGEDGADGTDINCSISRGLPMPGTPGTNGGDGEPGSAGGRGGNGGAVRIQLTCAAVDCAQLAPLLRAAARSEPGPGGPGGAGGKPGLGGRGGQFGHCTDRASALTSASDGRPGAGGARGPSGAAGVAGAIELQVNDAP
jgi:hypothetical protein